MKIFGIICLVVLLIGFCVVTSIVGKGCDWIGGVASRVANPDAAVNKYEWFHQQYQDIQAMTPKIAESQKADDDFKTSSGPRDKWTFDDRQEGARLASITTGLKQQRDSMVADYNARASMATQSLFKDHNLPSHVN